jgi:PHD/YefM family antitoxin component YafN of YafNO toxin-antitoxin module
MELNQLIEFVRGARHLVYKRKRCKKKQVVFTEEHYEMLMELETVLMKMKV